MRHTRKKTSINTLSPGLENTEKYGTKKFTSRKERELKELYEEFKKLYNKKIINSYDVTIIRGKNKSWKVESPAITSRISCYYNY